MNKKENFKTSLWSATRNFANVDNISKAARDVLRSVFQTAKSLHDTRWSVAFTRPWNDPVDIKMNELHKLVMQYR